MPIEERPFSPYGAMKKPSGIPKATFAAAGQRIASGCCGVGNGTGTMTPPSGAHCRQAPLVMNSGTGSRLLVASCIGIAGTRAATASTTAAPDTDPPTLAVASNVYASSTPISGISASAYRVGSAAVMTGRLEIWLYRLNQPVRTPLRVTFGPSDRYAISRPVTRIATTTGLLRRHHTNVKIAHAATTSSSGIPRYALYSVALVDSFPASADPASDSGENGVKLARSA